MKLLLSIAGIVFALGLGASVLYAPTALTEETQTESALIENAQHSPTAVATFAGGCFWCVEAVFETVPGVTDVISGYTGGDEISPTYKEVASGATGHTEAVQIHYDSSVITYDGLLETLWRTANPTDNNGQYVDRGQQYRPEIFYHNEVQKVAATISKNRLDGSGRYNKPVVIAITPASQFYQAEEYHQDYYKKNPVRYKFYTRNSGRYQFIDSVWPEGRDIDYSAYRPELPITRTQEAISMNAYDATSFVKPTDKELKDKLSRIQYKVTQKDSTERPFANPYHDEKRTGIYVDIVSGEPLFASVDKYDSGTGWPSFDKPIAEHAVIEKEDRSLFGLRIEIRSAIADSHLGHVFTDGPASTGLRYCMNSAAMRFIPLEQMASEGYGDYVDRVTNKVT